MNDRQRALNRCQDYYQGKVFSNRGFGLDQTWHSSKRYLEWLIQSLEQRFGSLERAEERFLLAVDRYVSTLESDAKPRGLTSMARDPDAFIQDFLDGWRPPPTVTKRKDQLGILNERHKESQAKHGPEVSAEERKQLLGNLEIPRR